MILADTNALVALLDDRDAMHRTASADLDVLARRRNLTTTVGVLSEFCHLLPDIRFRVRLSDFIRETPLTILPSRANWEEILPWLIKYGEHEPDWVDAELVLLSAAIPKVRVWSYDHEFATIWRRPNGSPVPLAVRRRV